MNVVNSIELDTIRSRSCPYGIGDTPTKQLGTMVSWRVLLNLDAKSEDANVTTDTLGCVPWNHVRSLIGSRQRTRASDGNQ